MDITPNGIQFHGEPKLVPHTDGVHWTVAEDYLVHDPVLGDLLVPKGFVTDLGSIPKIFQNIISPEGKPLRAYLVHDLLYARQTCTKDEADLCLKRLMGALGVPEYEVLTVYEAVALAGKEAWDNDARENKK